MSRTRPDGWSVVLLVAAMAGCLGLWFSGLDPWSIISRLRFGAGDGPRESGRQLFTLWLASIVWFVAAVAVLRRATHLVSAWVGRFAARRGSHSLRIDRGSTGHVTMLALGVVGLLKGQVVTQANEHQPVPVSAEGELSPRVAVTTRTDSSTASPMEALASAGLAAGIVGHVQRERARLLRESDGTAHLRAPSARSLAIGSTVFEKAKQSATQRDDSPTGIVTRNSVRQTGISFPLGLTGDQTVHVDLRPGEELAVAAPRDEAVLILRHLLNTVALAPWLDRPRVIAHGFDPDDVAIPQSVQIAESPAKAIELARRYRREVPHRPVILVTTDGRADFAPLLNDGSIVFRVAGASSRSGSVLAKQGSKWRYPTIAGTLRPFGMTRLETTEFRLMVNEMLVLESDSKQVAPSRSNWRVKAMVLGPVDIITRGSLPVKIRKSKSTELLCWLLFHRERATVASARTALWDASVADATFYNVLSELRRGLAMVDHPDGVIRLGKHRLALAEDITSDYDVLRYVLNESEDDPAPLQIARSLEALNSVLGLPFESANYVWADAEGITSTIVWSVQRLAEHTIELAERVGDSRAIVEAASAALRTIPGDEQFLELQRLATRKVRMLVSNGQHGPSGA